MKKTRLLTAIVALLALGATACNNAPASSEPAKSQPASVKPSSAPKSVAPTEDYLTVLPRTWTDGTPATNSDGKEYIPLTDSALNKVGVKISIKNYTVEDDATEGTTLADDGKIGAVNDHNAILTYKVVAPKAGAYQLVMRGKSKTDALEKTLDDRYFTVKLNGEEVDVVSSRAPLTDSTADFVGAPTVNLTGQEDTIKITCPDYRIQFDVNSFLIFAEH